MAEHKKGTLTKFLDESPIAERVRMPARLVLKRMGMSAREALELSGEGQKLEADAGPYDLEVGGLVVARGSIVRRKGGAYLKIVEVGGKDES
jgi:hypothetical protein